MLHIKKKYFSFVFILAILSIYTIHTNNNIATVNHVNAYDKNISPIIIQTNNDYSENDILTNFYFRRYTKKKKKDHPEHLPEECHEEEDNDEQDTEQESESDELDITEQEIEEDPEEDDDKEKNSNKKNKKMKRSKTK